MSTTRLSIWTLLEESLLCTQPARVEHSPSSIHMYKVSIFTRKMRARGVGALEVKQFRHLKEATLFGHTKSRGCRRYFFLPTEKKNSKCALDFLVTCRRILTKRRWRRRCCSLLSPLFSLQTRVGDAKRKRRQNHHGRPLLHISHQ